MSSPLDSTPANSVVSQQTYDSEEYALDKINSADEALAIIHDSGFFNHVRKGLFSQRKVLTLKMPNYIHEAPHAWFVQQLTRWHIC
ncbi:unnamed protein product [Penicillium camemberti]|uniref:Str. FM013 n=1 Tax=Penicillium camemberti (strain FM 013) TaxID=1429867 RepID=A0A0G4NVS0_PENC3|nr:unnamed protein product [Penicillium camemberti]